MDYDFILDASDESMLASHDIGVTLFAVDVSYKLGMAVGYQYGVKHPDRWTLDDIHPRFNRLVAYWSIGYGGSVYLHIGSDASKSHSLSFGEITMSGSDVLQFSDKAGCPFEYKVFAYNELRTPEFSLLVARLMEKRLKQIIRGITFSNQYGLCQSGCCVTPDKIQILSKIGSLWLCETCIDRFSLNEPLTDAPDETSKEVSEREKMTAGLRFDILVRDNFTCRACGRSPRKEDDVKLHVDHIKPIAHGGKTEPENLQVLCDICNLGKSAKWTRQIEFAFK